MSAVATETRDVGAELNRVFATLRAGYERNSYPSLAERLANLDRLKKVILARKEDIADAISEDFGNRSRHETYIAELFLCIECINYTKPRLKRWMKPRNAHIGLAFKPGRGKVHYQPLGVVGVIAPWNYPFQLAFLPIIGALAAGNRVMLKPSELTPRTGELMAQILEDTFPSDLVAVVNGGVDVAAKFSSLPFDHLLFTGSTHVGRLVMKAASENLTPVTLELGGKSPTIIHSSFPLDKAAENIVLGKWFNAGQTCIAPDYVLVPENQVDGLVKALRNKVQACYPTLVANKDYTSVVNERHLTRLQRYLDDARDKGAEIIELNPANESFEGTGKMVPTVVLNVTDDMVLMQDEIFGPILPIVPVRDVNHAIQYVNDRPRPLALYYFDWDAKRCENVLSRTTSGGVSLNSTMLHVAQEDMPFGSVGPSGMGAYHGIEGFKTFSHEKSVFYQAKLNATALLAPPYGGAINKLLKLLLR